MPVDIDVLHVCLRYTQDFNKIVRGYIEQTNPAYIDICTTVPPGTTEQFGPNAVHSTTRGLHPKLDESLLTFVKHIGGPAAPQLADYYKTAKIKTQIHTTARTTELAHILSNANYGINLMFADEMQTLCREYGVDYAEAVTAYNLTNNEGYRSLGHSSKQRMILYPPGGKIGGHCVVQGAQLIPTGDRTPLLAQLAAYGDKTNV